jgi:hypothetical protein
MKNRIVTFLEPIRRVKIAKKLAAPYSELIGRLLGAFDTFASYYAPKEPMPPISVVYLNPMFIEMVVRPWIEDEACHVDRVPTLLRRIGQEWLEDVFGALFALDGVPSWAKTLEPLVMFGKILKLRGKFPAALWFLCPGNEDVPPFKPNYRLLGLPSLLTHTSLQYEHVDTWREGGRHEDNLANALRFQCHLPLTGEIVRSMVQFSERAFKRSVTILRLCGFDCDSTSQDMLDERDPRFVCLKCRNDTSQCILTWRQAVRRMSFHHRRRFRADQMVTGTT